LTYLDKVWGGRFPRAHNELGWKVEGKKKLGKKRRKSRRAFTLQGVLGDEKSVSGRIYKRRHGRWGFIDITKI